jgi:hypothetical protein
MPSIYNSNASAVMGEARKQLAQNLMRAALFLEQQLMAKLGERTPATKDVKVAGKSRRVYVGPFSQPGEYPMKRTGFLQASIRHEPTKLSEVETTMRIKVGYRSEAAYGAILEVAKDRLGLKQTLADNASFLKQLADASVNMGPS